LSGEVKRGKSTVTKYYSRAGEITVKNVPIDGSKILSDDISRKLEPFYLEDSKTFDEDYLNGFYSNTSDMTYFDLKKSAAYRCHKMFADEIVKTVKAKNVKIQDSIYWVDVYDDPIYMMFPVWFFTFKYNDKPYTILVNGQSGKVAGTMPWQKKRVVALAVTTFVLVMTVIVLSILGVISNWLLLASVAPYVLAGITLLGAYSFTRGISGLRRIYKNLRLTQSEDIFKYVKKRQG
jgi:hypothetical protein